MTARLSIVVPTRDRPAHLDACLAALRAALRPGDELLVVDSASRDPAVAEVARAHQVRLIRCERPGASLARNTGAAAAVHDLIAYVDDDVRVDAGWADAIVAALANPAVAFVTGRVGVPPHQAGYQRPVAVNDGDAPAEFDEATTVGFGNSANLAVRREALVAVGGFDEALGGGARFQAAEDLDLFDRLLAAGHRGRYEPDAAAWHEQWRSRRELLRLDVRYGFGSGARLAKLARSDRRRAVAVARNVVWRGDIFTLGRMVRAREEFAVLTTAARILGTVAGFAAGLFRPVADGRYR